MKKHIPSHTLLSFIMLSACQVPQNTVRLNDATPSYLFQPHSGLPTEDEQARVAVEQAISPIASPVSAEAVMAKPTANTVKATPVTSTKQNSLLMKAVPSPSPSAKAIVSKDGNLIIPISSIQVSKEFDYASTQDISIQVSVNNPNGEAYKQVLVAVYALDGSGIKPIVSGVTNQQGIYTDLIRIPGYHEELNIQVSGFGIENAKTVSIQNNSIQAHFGK